MATTEREMVVRAGREGAAAAEPRAKSGEVTALTAEELELRMEGPKVDVPPEVEERAQAWIEDYKAKLTAQTERYIERLAMEQAAPAIGEPEHLGYVYWDLISISPVQFIGLPPYQPSKIIASGEVALFQAVLFINPATNIFNPISATTILGGRSVRVRFEQINLTDVADGPDVTFAGTFPSPAPVLTFLPVLAVAPDPGLNPRLIEQNVTADITDLAQPFAAFATHHFDIDSEPGFLGIPPQPPELQHDIPLRYLVYSK